MGVTKHYTCDVCGADMGKFAWAKIHHMATYRDPDLEGCSEREATCKAWGYHYVCFDCYKEHFEDIYDQICRIFKIGLYSNEKK